VNFKDYQAAQMNTVNTKLTVEENIINAALGLAGEAGEVTDLIKKWQYQGHELPKENIIKELGDCIWYVSLMANMLCVPLEEIARRNIEKLKARYPQGFTAERSINRDSESVK